MALLRCAQRLLGSGHVTVAALLKPFQAESKMFRVDKTLHNVVNAWMVQMPKPVQRRFLRLVIGQGENLRERFEHCI